MTKIEEIKDKVNKGRYIVCQESYHGTTWMDHEAHEDVEFLLKQLEKLQITLRFYASSNNYEWIEENFEENGVIVSTTHRTNVMEENGERARKALKEGSHD